MYLFNEIIRKDVCEQLKEVKMWISKWFYLQQQLVFYCNLVVRKHFKITLPVIIIVVCKMGNSRCCLYLKILYYLPSSHLWHCPLHPQAHSYSGKKIVLRIVKVVWMVVFFYINNFFSQTFSPNILYLYNRSISISCVVTFIINWPSDYLEISESDSRIFNNIVK